MKSVTKARTCQWCGAVYYLSDGRRKYCCDECAIAAHQYQARENYRRRYLLMHEEELKRMRERYARDRAQRRAQA